MPKISKNLTESRVLCNTKENPNIPDLRCRCYCFTLNNYTIEEKISIYSYLQTNQQIKFYVVGEEIGEIEKTPHLQGYMAFLNQKKYQEIVNKCIGFKRCHIEIARKDEQFNLRYCTKDFTNKNYITNIKSPPQLKIITDLYAWQQSMVELLAVEPDDRTIHWIIDEEGKNGKTQFLKYMVKHHNAIFTCGGKRNDIMNLIYNTRDVMLSQHNVVVIWNLPRDIDTTFISYEAIEMVKDGLISNNKFECGSFICNSPHIVVLCNQPPILRKLTADRWKLWQINENKELIVWEEPNPLGDD